jgi:hypothetical protein
MSKTIHWQLVQESSITTIKKQRGLMNLNKMKRTIMLPLKYWFYVIPYAVMSNPAVSRDLESIATNLSTKTNKLAMLVVPIGFAFSAFFMIIGSPRGAIFMSSTLLAAIITLGGTSVFSWLKGIVG